MQSLLMMLFTAQLFSQTVSTLANNLGITDFIILTWVGQKPVRDVYVLLGQVATFYYFLFFIVLIPVVGLIETKLAHYKVK